MRRLSAGIPKAGICSIAMFAALVLGGIPDGAAMAQTASENATSPDLIVMDPAALDKLPGSVAGDYLPFLEIMRLKGAKRTAEKQYNGTAGGLRVQVEEYQRIEMRLAQWPYDSVLIVVEGELTIKVPNGKAWHLRPGSVFVMPKGFSGDWIQKTAVRLVAVEPQVPAPPPQTPATKQ